MANTDGKRKEKKKKRRGLKIFGCILLILIICGAVFGYNVIINGGGLQGILATTFGHNKETLKNLSKIDFVIFGESEGLSDTIIVCSYDPKTQNASMLSIPRDAYTGVNINYATANDKINAKFAQSPEKSVEAVNKITGLELTNYVVVDTKALIELVDLLGGIWFDVPIDMKYDDYSQNLHINLKAGYQQLDGAKAEQVVRFRHNANGSTYSYEYGMEDIGRMKTQRAFITEVIKQTAKAQNIFKINSFLEIANKNIKTNMDLSILKDYAPYATNFNTEDLRAEVLPGEPKYGNGVALYVVDTTKAKALVDEMFLSLGQADGETETNISKE